MPDKEYEIEVLGEIYGSALLNVAQKENVVDEVTDDVRGIGEILKTNADFVQFIEDVTVAPDDQARAMEKIFTGRANVYTVELLKVMARRGRLAYLGGLVSAWEQLLRSLAGRVEVEVISAMDLSSESAERIRQVVAQHTGKKAELKLKTDPSIIGGIKLIVGDTLVDASIETQLWQIQSQLARGAAASAANVQSVIES
jgi:ATP synthase F1 delta subunit